MNDLQVLSNYSFSCLSYSRQAKLASIRDPFAPFCAQHFGLLEHLLAIREIHLACRSISMRRQLEDRVDNLAQTVRSSLDLATRLI